MSTLATARRGNLRRWLALAVGALAVLLVLGLLAPSGAGTALQPALGGDDAGALLSLALPA